MSSEYKLFVIICPVFCSNQPSLSAYIHIYMAHVTQYVGRCTVAQNAVAKAGSHAQAISKQEAEELLCILKKFHVHTDLVKAAQQKIVVMMEKTMQIGLAQCDFDKVVDELGKLNAMKTRSSWKMQDYTNIANYFSDDEWKSFRTHRVSSVEYDSQFGSNCAMVSMDCIQQIVFRKAIQLGCRHPSEKTTKLWTTFGIALCNTAWLEQMPSHGDMKVAHVSTKAKFKKYVPAALLTTHAPLIDASTGLDELPIHPAGLKQRHPDVYEFAFGDGSDARAPVDPQVDMAMVHVHANLWTCRGGVTVSPYMRMVQPIRNAIRAPPQLLQQMPDLGLTIYDTPRRPNQLRRSDSFSSIGMESPLSAAHSRLALGDDRQADGLVASAEHALPPRPPATADDPHLGSRLPSGFNIGMRTATSAAVYDALTERAADAKARTADAKAAKKAAAERSALVAVAGEQDVGDDCGEATSHGAPSNGGKAKPIKKRPATATIKGKTKKTSHNVGTKYCLRLEQTRHQILASNGTRWKSFTWGSGRSFKSQTQAQAGAYAYLDKVLKDDGKGVKFPRHCNQIVI